MGVWRGIKFGGLTVERPEANASLAQVRDFLLIFVSVAAITRVPDASSYEDEVCRLMFEYNRQWGLFEVLNL
jgi:hypothetical protein